jgi:hypothetical protein
MYSIWSGILMAFLGIDTPSLSLKEGKKRAIMCASTYKVRRATAVFAHAQFLPPLDACSARTQSLSQIEKPALEMRETRSLVHLPTLLPHTGLWALRHSAAETQGCGDRNRPVPPRIATSAFVAVSPLFPLNG